MTGRVTRDDCTSSGAGHWIHVVQAQVWMRRADEGRPVHLVTIHDDGWIDLDPADRDGDGDGDSDRIRCWTHDPADARERLAGHRAHERDVGASIALVFGPMSLLVFTVAGGRALLSLSLIHI